MTSRTCNRVIMGALAVAVGLAAGNLRGDITTVGDVSPASPSTWTTQSYGYIGNVLDGSITVTNGSILFSSVCYLGNAPGATGTITVDGTGSAWIGDSVHLGQSGNGEIAIIHGASASASSVILAGANDGRGQLTVDGYGSHWICEYLTIGVRAPGTIQIFNGSQVTVAVDTWINQGSIDFGSAGGTLTTVGLLAGASQFTGMGTVNTQGLIIDGTLVLDATHPLKQTLVWNSSNQAITVNLDLSGSAWPPRQFGAGFIGNGSLTISDGINVTSQTGYIAYAAGSSGIVTVAGKSTWATNFLELGLGGNGTLTVTNGGTVTSNAATLGVNALAHGTATVSGSGSTWTNIREIVVGGAGMGTLNIFNGGSVAVGEATYVTASQTANGVINFGIIGGTLSTRTLYASPNQITGSGFIKARGLVTDGDLIFDATRGASQQQIWTGENQNVTVDLDLTGKSGDAGDLGVGYQGVGHLTIRNGAVIPASSAMLGYLSDSTGIALVTGNGSQWNLSSGVTVGYAGTGDLTIADGAKLTCSRGYISYASGIGKITVDGKGSSWTMGDLSVRPSSLGTLNITNGALVNVTGGAEFSSESGGTAWVNFGTSGGTLTATSLKASSSFFTGTGSIYTCGLVIDRDLTFDASHGANQTQTWTGDNQNIMVHLDATGASGTLGVLGTGFLGQGTLTIRDGVTVKSSEGILAATRDSKAWGIVDGAGSTWNTGNVSVGYLGAGDFKILHGATVVSSDSHVAASAYVAGPASVGTVLVDGSGSKWTSSRMFAGDLGNGSISVTNQGDLEVTGMSWIAYGFRSTGSVTVDGSSSIWNTASTLWAGNNGASELNITRGAAVMCRDAILATSAASSSVGNVTGSGSTWISGGSLTVGNGGSAALNIAGGGSVSVALNSYVGNNIGSVGTVLVDGSGSSWKTTNTLFVGNLGTADITLAHGGIVTASASVIGNATGSAGTVTIDGAGSNWACRSTTIGNSGFGFLRIVNGAQLNASSSAYLAFSSKSFGSATIDGPGSAWNNSTPIYAGYVGSAKVTVSNGGKISNTVGYIAYYASSEAGVTIDGTGSIWTTSSDFYAGYNGTGAITITSGGQLANQNAYLGYNTGSVGSVTVDGNGSIWTTPTALYVGNSGLGTLAVTNGGRVSSSLGYIGQNAGSVGSATLDGDNSIWTNTYALYVGNSGNGTLAISKGAQLNSAGAYIGYGKTSTGSVTIDGIASAWIDTSTLYLGYNGKGALTVTNGARHNSAGGYLGYSSGSSGSVVMDGAATRWSSPYALYIGNSGSGSLSIRNGAILNSAGAYLGYNSGSSGSTVIDGTASSWIDSSVLFVGNSGTGAISVVNGARLDSFGGYVGFNAGSTGTVAVDGPSSKWTNASALYVGYSGTGTLLVSNGAKISAALVNLGNYAAAIGRITVDGAGSTLASGGDLHIGNSGAGTVNITTGGHVTAKNVSIAPNSLVIVEVGDASLLSADSGTLTNNGVIRLNAMDGLASGIYSPITAAAWSGTGAVQALGGSWSASSHVFSVSSPAAGATDSPVSINLSQTQRIAITDLASGDHLCANFAGSGGDSNLTFTASMLSDTQASLLATMAPIDDLLCGWSFAATGYTQGSPIFFSMDIGPAHSIEELSVWHFDGVVWTPYLANDLSYDGDCANFTVTGLSSYAITTTPAPEPAGLALLGLGGFLLAWRRRR